MTHNLWTFPPMTTSNVNRNQWIKLKMWKIILNLVMTFNITPIKYRPLVDILFWNTNIKLWTEITQICKFVFVITELRLVLMKKCWKDRYAKVYHSIASAARSVCSIISCCATRIRSEQVSATVYAVNEQFRIVIKDTNLTKHFQRLVNHNDDVPIFHQFHRVNSNKNGNASVT